jgi:hypothetical protein
MRNALMRSGRRSDRSVSGGAGDLVGVVMRTVLACGDRNWTDVASIRLAMRAEHLGSGDVLIHGDCRGADHLADLVALELGMTSKPYPADWDTHGKKAGPIRNRQMLKENPEIDLVLAFHDRLDESKGTADMVRAATKAGIRVNVYHSSAEPPQ